VGIDEQVIEVELVQQGIEIIAQAVDVVAFIQEAGDGLCRQGRRHQPAFAGRLRAAVLGDVVSHLGDGALAAQKIVQGQLDLFLIEVEQDVDAGGLQIGIEHRHALTGRLGTHRDIGGHIGLAGPTPVRVDGNDLPVSHLASAGLLVDVEWRPLRTAPGLAIGETSVI
jgi:hypothetical protein